MSENTLQSGSLREVWKVSSSLMISFFSMMAMAFIDRLYLANYSQSALTAAASAGTFSWAIVLGVSSLTTMTEVFVAQFNGAKKFKRLGEPVWQAVWISLFALAVFVPLSTLLGYFLFDVGVFTRQEETYFNWSMVFVPAYALMTGLTGFFVGQGKTSIVKWLAVGGNTINVILDPIFIFGIPGYFPSCGIAGAVVATGIGIIFQVVIFAWVFLSKQNAAEYNTHNVTFNVSLLWQILRIGTPPAIFVLFELLGWAMFYFMMEVVSPIHIVVVSVSQSIMMLFLFFGLGLEKGVAAVTGNLLGAGLHDRVPRVVRSGMILVAGFAAFILTIFAFAPEPIINWFFNNPEALEQVDDFMQFTPEALAQTKTLVRSSLLFVGFYLIFENIRWVFGGILTAAGDTLFLMISGVICIWGLMVAPTYYFVVVQGAAIHVAFYIWVFYAFSAALMIYLRYAFGYWRTKQIIDDSTPLSEVSSNDA